MGGMVDTAPGICDADGERRIDSPGKMSKQGKCKGIMTAIVDRALLPKPDGSI